MPVNGNHTKRSAPMVMGRLALLVRPLAGYMALAILAGLAGHLCAAFLTVLGASAVLAAGGYALPLSAGTALVLLAVFAVLRGPLRYGEQALQPFYRLQAAGPDPGQGVPGAAAALPRQAGGPGPG